MPSTVTPRIYTAALLTVTNDLKYVIYAASDPLAEVDSQTFAPPHDERVVSFPGLDRVNYIFKLLEMVAGVPIRQRAKFDFNPDNSDFEYRSPEEIVVDTAGGPAGGTASVLYDGTGGRADWRGWNPIFFPPAIGPLMKLFNYSWNPVTGEWTITDLDNPVFQPGARYLVEFEPRTVAGAPGVPGGRVFTEVLEMTADNTTTAVDIGKKWLAKPGVAKIVVLMPVLNTVVANRITFVETVKKLAGPSFCVEYTCQGGDTWDDGSTVKRLLPGEKFEFYKYAAFGDDPTYRTQSESPGMLTVGREFSGGADSYLNCQLLDGTIGNVDTNARIWLEHIANLDPAQRVPYATWEADVTKRTYWSDENSDVPAKFHFPDRRGLTEKNAADGQTVSTPEPQQLLKHQHVTASGGLNDLNPTGLNRFGKTIANFLIGTMGGPVSSTRDITSRAVDAGQADATPVDGDENRVNSYLNNKFVQL